MQGSNHDLSRQLRVGREVCDGVILQRAARFNFAHHLGQRLKIMGVLGSAAQCFPEIDPLLDFMQP
jgi:hypothetical protein